MAPADNDLTRLLVLVEGMSQQMLRWDAAQDERIREAERGIAHVNERVTECAAKHEMTAHAITEIRATATKMDAALVSLVGLRNQGRGVALTLMALWALSLVVIGAMAQAYFPRIIKG